MQNLFFLSLGLFVGTLGTLIGAGGGFLLVPLLLFMFPEYPTTKVTAISMLAVAANSISGSWAYARKRQIHWKSVWIFSIVSIPGIFLGLHLAKSVAREQFEFIFGILLS